VARGSQELLRGSQQFILGKQGNAEKRRARGALGHNRKKEKNKKKEETVGKPTGEWRKWGLEHHVQRKT